MYLTLIVLPLLGSILSGFFGRKLGVTGSQIITCTCVILTTILAITCFFEVGLNNAPVHIKLLRWIDSESLNISWGFLFDSLTVSMLIPVLIVSSLVHIYSISYMGHDPHPQRFFSYLSLFTFMMIILVTGDNYLLMFVGWEGVGVCSYLLVSFWYTRIPANQSSLSAFLTNRVGDCFLTIGMFAILWAFGNLEYSTVFSIAPFMSNSVITLVGICLFIGAMAKSSQIGLHVWLPMAMEGPTPVSALIHAATMVTAGVYLLMRSSPLIEYSNTVLLIALWIGAITTVFSSLIGLYQNDIKKVIAYSTMSQLGMMVIAIGLSSYNLALFHLVNHAFYKALLFLGAGAVIHAVADNQDFRKFGGLRIFLPLTYSVMVIASLSLVAFPYMTGFYSKDFILESAYGDFFFSGTSVYYIATIGAMFTTLYSIKVLYLTFLGNPNGPIANYRIAHEGDIYMSLPLVILAIFSIFFGYITKDMFIGIGTDFFVDNSIFIHPSHEKVIQTEFAVPTIFKLLPFIFTVALSIVAIVGSENIFGKRKLSSFKLSRIGYNVFGLLNQRFLFESLYNKYVTNGVLKLGGQTTKVIDKGSIERMGPYGSEVSLNKKSEDLSKISTGPITTIAVLILVGLIFMITTFVYIDTIGVYELIILFIIVLFYLVKKEYTSYKKTENIEKVSLPVNNPENKTVSTSTSKSTKSSNEQTKSKNSSGKVIISSTFSRPTVASHSSLTVGNNQTRSFSSSSPLNENNTTFETELAVAKRDLVTKQGQIIRKEYQISEAENDWISLSDRVIQKEDAANDHKVKIEENLKNIPGGDSEAVKDDLDAIASVKEDKDIEIENVLQGSEESTVSDLFRKEVADLKNEKDAWYTSSLEEAVNKAKANGDNTGQETDYDSLHADILKAKQYDEDLQKHRRSLVEESENLLEQRETLDNLKEETNTIIDKIVSILLDSI